MASEIDRSELLEALTTVKPAILSGDLAPVLSCFCFDGSSVTAFDDVLALSVECPLKIKAALPASLHSLVRSFTGKTVSIDVKDRQALIKCGRSRVKLPCVSSDTFLFKRPKGNRRVSVTLGESLHKALTHCIAFCGGDERIPLQAGVNVIFKDRLLSFYSTNNVSIACASIELEEKHKEIAFVMPLPFCKQVAKLIAKTEAVFNVGTDFVEALIDDGARYAFSKVPAEPRVSSFEDAIARVSTHSNTNEVHLPSKALGAFKRAQILLGKRDDRRVNLGVYESRLKVFLTDRDFEAGSTGELVETVSVGDSSQDSKGVVASVDCDSAVKALSLLESPSLELVHGAVLFREYASKDSVDVSARVYVVATI